MNAGIYSVTRFRKAIVHFLGGRLLQLVASVVWLLTVVRLLSLADYGAYITLLGLVELMAPLASLGLVEAGQRFVPEAAESGRASAIRVVSVLLGARLITVLALATCMWIIWPALSGWLDFSVLHDSLAGLVIGLAVAMLMFRFAAELLEALLEQAAAQSLRLLQPMVKLGALGILFIGSIGVDVWWIMTIEMVAAAVCMVLALAAVTMKLRALPAGAAEPPGVNKITRFAWHMAGARWLNAAVDPGAMRLVVAGHLGLAEAGLFGFVQSATGLLGRYLPASVLMGLVRPMLIARAHGAEGVSLLNSGAGLMWKSNLLIIGALFVTVMAAGDTLVAAASADKYTQAGLLVALWLVYAVLQSQRRVLDMVLQIKGHSAQLRQAALFGPFILAGAIAVASNGLYVVTGMIILGNALWNGFLLRALYKRPANFSLDWFGGVRVLAAAGAGALTGVVCAVWFATLWISVLASIAAYIVILLRSKPFRRSETDLVQRVVGMPVTRHLIAFSR